MNNDDQICLKQVEERAYWLYIKVTDLKRLEFEVKEKNIRSNEKIENEIATCEYYESWYKHALSDLAMFYKAPSSEIAEANFLNKYAELKKL